MEYSDDADEYEDSRAFEAIIIHSVGIVLIFGLN